MGPALVPHLPSLPSCPQELCRTGLQVALTHCTSSKHRDSSSQLQLQGQHFLSRAAFPAGDCSCGLSPEVQLEECSSLKSARSIALLFILKAFLCRWAVVDIAGVLIFIHKPEVQDDMEQVLPFHRSIFILSSHHLGRNCSGFKHQMRRPHKNYTESDSFLSIIQFGWRKFSAFYINQQNSHSIETFNSKV